MKMLIAFVFIASCVAANPVQKRRTILSSLNPRSVQQHLAFYQLHSDTDEGRLSLERAWLLLSDSNTNFKRPLSTHLEQHLIDRLLQSNTATLPNLTTEELDLINELSQPLANRTLKGHYAMSEEEILSLQPEDIDISRALLLSQETPLDSIKQYGALLDLMALQVRAKLPYDANSEEIINTMNQFLFFEQEFKFPPSSEWKTDIDKFTSLTKVIDSKRGVCLGISLLYLCLAQRLGLNLEIITPPGHIYLRHSDINIETTARGIDVESEFYLGMNTCRLQKRTLKEALGLAHINQASVYLQTADFNQALSCYQKAKKYLPKDTNLNTLMGYCLLFEGNEEAAMVHLCEPKQTPYEITCNDLAEDYLNHRCSIDAMRTLITLTDESREALKDKRNTLIKHLEKHPRFLAGKFYLGMLSLELHSEKEALKALRDYHLQSPNHPMVEYLLTLLYMERLNYPKAWKHYNNLESILYAHSHQPKALSKLKKELFLLSPKID